MAVTRICFAGHAYIEKIWADNSDYFADSPADAWRYVTTQDVEDGVYDTNEPEWYKEVYSEV